MKVDASNIVWIDQPKIPASANGAKVAFLWGNPQGNQLYRTVVKLLVGFTVKRRSHAPTFHGVAIQGQTKYQVSGKTHSKTLEPGSYFGFKGEFVDEVSSPDLEESIIYVRTDGKFHVIPS